MKFSLKSFFVAVSIIAILMGLIGTRFHSYKLQKYAIEQLGGLHPDVTWKYWNVVELGIAHLDEGSEEINPNVKVKHFTNKELELLTAMKYLRYLNISGTDITDDGLRTLSNHRRLHTLLICDCDISDIGLKHLADLTNLKSLGINNTKVTPHGLSFLSEQLPKTRIYFGERDYWDSLDYR